MPLRRRTAIALVIALGLAGCESFRSNTSNEPSAVAAAAPSLTTRRPAKHWLRVGPYVIHSDTKLDPNDPIFRDLAELPEQIQTELELPPSDALVQVFLFDSAEKYDEYMKSHRSYKRLPKRRAYFFVEPRVGGGDDLLVYTWVSEHLQKDLRHELTHATLHGTLKGVPLWLDEGLAGFFELPRTAQGVNASHLDVLRRGPFLPDMARLESLGQVHQMETPEYREAWAWVHLMLRGDTSARRVLLDYLQQLRTTATPGPMLPKLQAAVNDPNKSLADHLTRTDFPALSVSAPAR